MNFNGKKNKTLFILCLPFSGTTILVKLIGTSKNSSIFSSKNHEGQQLQEIRNFMRDKSWDIEKKIPWDHVKKIYEKNWDLNKTVQVEKSPPNLIRAKEIEKKFENPYFIVMTRNPYAWCAGMKPRMPENSYTHIATTWIDRIKYQKYNIENLSQVLFFSYEQFCDDPEGVAKMISKFIPELSDIDVKSKFTVPSKSGISKKSITNFNFSAISKLSQKDIEEISNVLKYENTLLKYFSYEIMK